ncbi:MULTISPECIES: hypothetical protein [unclassified Streptomyces]|uniref:hypothetical protein n=1 Tax=unclassified Streptomyces TaxID=2593676 RepID=UPI0038119A37
MTRVFSEKIPTRATGRPELEAAVKLAGEIRSSKKGQHPSPATVMRMPREHDEQTAASSMEPAP